MGSVKLNLPSLVEMPIALGATTPVPARWQSVLAWSTIENDAVVWDGGQWVIAGFNDLQNIYAVGGLSATSYFTSSGTSPEPGLAGPFGSAILFRLTTLSTATQYVLSCYNTSAINASWSYKLLSGTQLSVEYRFADGSNAISTNAYHFVPSDIDKLFVAISFYTGTALHLRVSRALVGGASTSTGGATFVPSVNPLLLGTGNNQPFATGEAVAAMTFRGFPTGPEINTFFDTTRHTGDLPATFGATTNLHRWSLRETLLGQSVSVGKIAPSPLIDTATLVPANQLNRVGTPKVSIVDPRREGRTLYGITAFAADYRTESEAGKGIRGKSTGFWVSFSAQFVGSLGGYPATCGTTDLLTGWAFYRTSSGGLWVYCGINASNGALAVSASPPMHTPFVVHLLWNGSTAEFFLNGVSTGKSGVGTYVPPGASVYTTVGNNMANTFPSSYDSIYGLAGGDYPVTPAEIAQNAEAFKRLGRMQPIAGKTDHFYDFTADVQNAPDVEIPAPNVTLDSLGNEPLYQKGGYVLFADGLLNTDASVAGGIANTFYRASRIPSGTDTRSYPGSATGFWISVLSYNAGEALPAQGTFFTNTDSAMASGFQLCTNGSIVFQARTSAGLVTLSLGTEPVGYTHTLIHYNGSKFDGYINGTLVASTATGQVYTPGNVAPVCIGSLGTSYPLLTRAILGVAAGDFSLLAAEITTASLQSHANRKIFATPAKTSCHWSIVDDIAEAGYTVPNRLKERINGITNLGLYTDLKNRRIASAPGEGLRGGASAWVAWYGTVNELLNPQFIFFGECRINTAPIAGWLLGAISANSVNVIFRYHHVDGSSAQSSAFSLGPADLKRPLLIVGVRTANGFLRLYKDRAQVGSDIGISQVMQAPAAASMVVQDPANSNTITTKGFAGSDSHDLTQAEVFQLYDDVARAGRIQSVPGKTEHLWVIPQTTVIKKDHLALPRFEDRIGKDPLLSGLGVCTDYRITARGDYRGITGFHTYRSILTRKETSFPGVATGFWASAMVSHDVLYSYPKIFFGQWGSNAGGWHIGSTSSTNPRPSVTLYTTATTSVSVAAADGTDANTVMRVGDIRHIAFSYDGAQVRLYVNGVLAGGPTPAASYTPFAVGHTAIGAGDINGVYGAFGYSVYGAAAGNFVPTDAEMFTAAQESFKQNAMVAIPAKTDVHWDFKRDIQERQGLLPNTFKDRINGTATMVRTGTYLQTTTTRQRNWAYDTTPTMYGITGFSAANYLQAYKLGVCNGDPWSFFVTVAFIVNSQAGASGVRSLVAARDLTAKLGYAINTGGSNASVYGFYGTPTQDYSTAVGTTSAAMPGKVQLVTMMYDGLRNQMWLAQNALPVGSYSGPPAGSYFAPRVGVPFTVGILSDLTSQPATDLTILGAAYGNANFTTQEHRKVYYDLLANESLPAHVKMTSVWDFTSTIRKNNGLLPAYIPDEVGGNALQVVGSPTVDAIYHRSFAT